MKKCVSIILILILAFTLTLTGCGGSGGSAEDTSADTAQSEHTDKAEAADAATDGMGDLLSAAYVDIMKGDKYLMKYKATLDMDGQPMEVEATIAVSGDATAMQSTGNGFETSMITKDGKIYMIDHANKMVTSMAEPTQDQEAAAQQEAETIGMEGLKYIGTGEEDGLVYEEYSTTDGTLKYYFDGKELKRISATIGGVETVMDILELSDKVPADMFEVPADYQMVEM